MTGTSVIHHFWHFCGQGIQFDGYNIVNWVIFQVIYKKMLEFRFLTSILTGYRKVTMLKHGTILNNYLLENNISIK